MSLWLDRRVWRVRALSVCLPALWLASAGSAQSTIAVSSKPLFDGACIGGHWAGAAVTIENRGDSTTGTLTAHLLDGSEPTYQLAVDLPSGARKRYFVYLDTVVGSWAFRCELRTKDGVYKRFDVNFVPVTDARIVLGVAADPAEIPSSLSKLQLPGGVLTSGSYGPPRASAATARVIRAVPDELPDRWLGYDGIDLIWITDLDTNRLSVEQQKALRQWVVRGGTLFVNGDPQWRRFQTEFYHGLLPAEVIGAGDDDLSSVAGGHGLPPGRQVVLRCRPSPSARLLLGTANTPLVLTAPYGAGQVIQSAIDFTAEPLRSSGVGGQLLLSLLPAHMGMGEPIHLINTSPYGYSSYSIRSGIRSAFLTAAKVRLPSSALIAGWLILYLVLLVPGNYIILRRLDRREWTWFTVPAIAVVFTLGAYGIGYSMRGGVLKTFSATLLSTQTDAVKARADSIVGILSPGRHTYRLVPPPDAVVSSLPDEGQEATTTIFEQENFEAAAEVNMWALETFAVAGEESIGGGIHDVWRVDRDGARVTVGNDTGINFDQAAVIVGCPRLRGVAVPGLRAGATVQTDLTALRPPAPGSSGSSFLAASDPMQRRLLAMVVGQDPSPLSDEMLHGPLLVAMNSHPGLRLTLDLRPGAKQHATMLVCRLRPRFTAVPATLPPFLLSMRVVASAPENQVRLRASGWECGTASGLLVLEYLPPDMPAAARPRSLSISCAGTISGSLEIFNFRKGTWRSLPSAALGSGASGVALHDPQPCFDPVDGRIRLRVHGVMHNAVIAPTFSYGK